MNQLSILSDQQLLEQLNALRKKEAECTIEILFHLYEVERRKLFLDYGHSSLFAYCTSGLGYSESAANRRIRSARCLRDFPQVLPLLRDRRVNLSTLSLVYGVLNPKNVSEVLDKVSCKTRREVESVVASYRGRSVKVKDRIRPLGGMKKEVGSKRVTARPDKDSTVVDLFTSEEMSIRGGCGVAFTENEAALSEPALEQSFELRFEVSEEVMKKYQEAELLLSKKYPRGVSLGDVMEELLEVFLEQKSPERRAERREKRKAVKVKAKEVSNDRIPVPVPSIKAKPAEETTTASRHIPLPIRDEVFRRDDYCCSYVGVDGRRCGSRWNLEVDHIVPFSKGGQHLTHNLRVVCAAHNRRAAEKEFGVEFMEQFR